MSPAATQRLLARLVITGSPSLSSPTGEARLGPSAGAQRLRGPGQLGGAPARPGGAAPVAGLATTRDTPP